VDCANPICNNRIEESPTGTWRRTPRFFCCDRCQKETQALRVASRLLLPLGELRGWHVITECGTG